MTTGPCSGAFIFLPSERKKKGYVVPERLYPWLGMISGLTIAALGLFLIFDRYAVHRRSNAHAHSHGHGHSHGNETTPLESEREEVHGHAHPHTHPHVHGPHTHRHHYEPGDDVSFGRLLTLGVTGGIVPCPAALVVLLSAVAVRRIGFGLLLIVAFSMGLAVVLIAIGLVMVYARRFLSRFSGDTPLVTRWLPLTSATVITLFGMAMAIQALLTI